ncbi:MAG: universal stress protein [Actinomycetota bacterium]|nr:universal stress protein [Actinomycetota bacterium]
MTTETAPDAAARPLPELRHIAVAIDTAAQSQDAMRLGSLIAAAVDGDLMLLTVEPELSLLLPGLDRQSVRRETETMLSQVRSAYAPEARTAITADLSVARGLRRLARADHRQLLVVGSGSHGPTGEVSLGHDARQVLAGLQGALAIAPRGLSGLPDFRLRRIGVGFDGGAEGAAALAAAATLVHGSSAELVVRGVIDDHVPALGWPQVWMGDIMEAWTEIMDDEAQDLERQIQAAVSDLKVEATVAVTRGRSADALRELSAELDLLVIGSRRWGPLARLLLGGTGEGLVHGSRCPLLIVARPTHTHA